METSPGTGASVDVKGLSFSPYNIGLSPWKQVVVMGRCVGIGVRGTLFSVGQGNLFSVLF